jgi:HEAT repeat protein
MLESILIGALATASVGSSHDAVEAIAENTESRPEAVAYLRGKGRVGLWAVTGAVKRETGARRRHLLTAVGDLPFEGAEWSLRTAYDDGDVDSQVGALNGLAKLGGATAERLMVQGLQSPKPEVRAAAVRGLRSRTERVRSQLHTLARSSDETTRIGVLELVAASPDRRLARSVLRDGLVDARPAVQRAALAALEARAMPEFTDEASVLLDSSDPTVARAAVRAIGAFPGGQRDRSMRRVLTDASVPTEVRTEAVTVLRRRGAFEPLFAGLTRTPDGEALLVASLSSSGPSPAEKSQWVAGLGRRSPAERRLAQRALEALGRQVQPDLVAALASSDRRVRTGALAVLEQGGDEALDEVLTRAVRADDAEQRAGAWSARIARARPETALTYVEALDDRAPAVRTAAARALAVRGEPKVDSALEARLTDLDRSTQQAVLDGASERTDRSFQTSLAIRLLAADDPSVRRVALQALTPAPGTEALDALSAHIRRAPSDEKTLAVQALGESRLPRAGSMLVELVTDVDPDVRRAALRYVDRL